MPSALILVEVVGRSIGRRCEHTSKPNSIRLTDRVSCPRRIRAEDGDSNDGRQSEPEIRWEGQSKTEIRTKMEIFQCCATPDRGLCPAKDKKRFDETVGRHSRPFIPPGEGPPSEEIPKLVLVLQSWAKSDFVSDPNTVMHCKLGARASPLRSYFLLCYVLPREADIIFRRHRPL